MMTSVPITWPALTTSVRIPALAPTARAEATLSARFPITAQSAPVPMATRVILSPNALAQDEAEFGSFESSNEIFYHETYQKSRNVRTRISFCRTFRYLLKTIALPKRHAIEKLRSGFSSFSILSQEK